VNKSRQIETAIVGAEDEVVTWALSMHWRYFCVYNEESSLNG